jgi:hypothetical protein
MSFTSNEKDLVAKMKQQFTPAELQSLISLTKNDSMVWNLGSQIYNNLTSAVPELSEVPYLGAQSNDHCGCITLICGQKLGRIPTIILWTIMSKLETLCRMSGGVRRQTKKDQDWDDMEVIADSPVLATKSSIVTLDKDVDYREIAKTYADTSRPWDESKKT